MRLAAGVALLLWAMHPAAAQTTPQREAAPQARHQGAGAVRPKAAAPSRRKGAPPIRNAGAPAREAALPLEEQLALQLDLAWAGELSGVVDGEPNERTTAAIKTFQRSRKLKETGVLNPQERALLAAAARARQTRVGWRMIDDPVTGARLGIPSKEVSINTPGKSGNRWSTAQGQVQIETFRIRDPGTTLALVHEQQRKEPATRRLAVNLLRADHFVLAGMQGLKRFYVRAQIRDGEVRGLTILFDQATEPVMEPVAVVMTATFVAFPGLDGLAQGGQPPRRKVEYGTGIVVSSYGHVLTSRDLTDGCRAIVIGGQGDADRQAEDPQGLALLRLYGAAGLVPVAFSAAAGKPSEVTLIGIADPQSQDGGGAVSAISGRLTSELVEPAPRTGFSGGAVLDTQGRLIGVVLLRSPRDDAGGPASTRAVVVSAVAARAFLERHQLPPATATAGVAAARASLVRVICVRS
jgi:peptidoglycan hydrolase-like protein with peptidoglycan-binding domain